MVRVRVSISVRVGVGVADCCIQTAGKSDKMRINHLIKTDQWRSVPQIRPAPHFVVSLILPVKLDAFDEAESTVTAVCAAR